MQFKSFICCLALLGGLMNAPGAGAATLTVTTLDDVINATDGVCSLREAIDNAAGDNQIRSDCAEGTGDDVISFDAGLFSGSPPEAVIALNSQLAVGDGGGPTGALSIAPPGGHRVILQGNGSERIMSIGARASPFVLQDGEIRGGRALTGGGISMTSPNVTFTRVHFIDNIASFTGAGGGAIYRNVGSVGGVLQIEDCWFEDNAATNQGGGAIYLVDGGVYDVTITDSVFLNNSANFGGAALYFRVPALSGPGTSSLDIVASRFQGGTADAGAALSIAANSSDSRVEVSIADSLFRDNRADGSGGAIAVEGHEQGTQQSLDVRRSTFLDNGADGSGGGGALRVSNMDVWMENNLLLGNDAPGSWGVLAVNNGGSALPRSLRLVGNSFHHNSLTGTSGRRTLVLRAPLDASGWEWHIAGNLFDPHTDPLPGDAAECALSGGTQGALTLTGGANISPDADCLFMDAADIQDDPMVALENTGDSLKPRNLLPQIGSPAIDLWPAVDCDGADGNPLIDDLRGDPRPGDGDAVGDTDCDAGAFELPDAGLVTVTRDGTGGGTVVSNPAGIDCGAECSAGFAEGTDVALTATAGTGSVFTGWSGDCSGDGSCLLNVDGDKNVTATFEDLPSFVLDVALTGDGGGQVSSAPSGIDCEPSCSASFAEGTEVTLTASPSAESVFDGWSGGGCSGAGDCVLTLNADITVTAEFSATHFPVTVGLPGNGIGSVTSDPAGIDCPDDCQVQFARTEIVTLAATAASGSVFLGWEGDCAAFGTADCELDMDKGPYQADARFERERTLTVAMSGGGTGAVTSDPAGIDCPGDCSEAYLQGTGVELAAIADAGSVFAGWSGACSGTGGCVVSMDADRSVTAVFQTGGFTLDVAVTGEGNIASNPSGINCPGDCSETYLAGSEIELIATPQPGHSFAGWSGDCAGTGACTVAMDQARSVGALFEEDVDGIFADRFESP